MSQLRFTSGHRIDFGTEATEEFRGQEFTLGPFYDQDDLVFWACAEFTRLFAAAYPAPAWAAADEEC